MERAMGNLLRHKTVFERGFDWTRLRLSRRSGVVPIERKLAHEVGLSLWNVVRALMYPRLPGVWSRSRSVQSLSFSLHGARKSLWAMRAYREEQVRGRESWEFPWKVRRSLVHAGRQLLRAKCFERGIYLDREWRMTRIQRLLAAVDELDGGTSANRLALSRVLLQEAEDMMLKPTLQHSMLLLLYVYVSSDEALCFDNGERDPGAPYEDVERCFRYVEKMPGYDRRMEAVYGSRRALIQGLKATAAFRVRAQVLAAHDRRFSDLEREYRGGRKHLLRAIAYCRELHSGFGCQDSRHLAPLAHLRLWLAAVAMEDWDVARSDWTNLVRENPEFVMHALPRIREFADLAADFATKGNASLRMIYEVEECLERALGIVEHASWCESPALGPGRFGVDTVEELLEGIDAAKRAKARQAALRRSRAVFDQEHMETAARALDVIRAYRRLYVREAQPVDSPAAQYSPEPAPQIKGVPVSHELVQRSNRRRREIMTTIRSVPSERKEDVRLVLRALPSIADIDSAEFGRRGKDVVKRVLHRQLQSEGIEMDMETLERALSAIHRSRKHVEPEPEFAGGDYADQLRDAAEGLDLSSSDQAGEVAAHLLNLIRVMAARLVSKHYGEGIRDIADSKLADVLQTCSKKGAVELESFESQLEELIGALRTSHGEVDDCRQAQELAGELLHCLVPAHHPFAGLAEINLLLPDKENLDEADYHRLMSGVADRCLKWCDEKSGGEPRSRAGKDGYDFPAPARIASYALNNSLTLILHRIVTGRITEPKEWLPVVRRNIERMRRNDGAFELIALAEAFRLAIEGWMTEDDSSFFEFIHRLGREPAADLMATALAEEDSDELVDLLCRGIEKVYGAQAITMVTAGTGV